MKHSRSFIAEFWCLFNQEQCDKGKMGIYRCFTVIKGQSSNINYIQDLYCP